jgi:phospholipase D1/2
MGATNDEAKDRPPAHLTTRVLRTAALVLAIGTLVVGLWKFTPVQSLQNSEDIARLLTPLRESVWLPVVLWLVFLAAGMILLSVWVVIVQTCLLLPPWSAIPVALIGAMLSATCFYGAGRLFGRETVARIAPARVRTSVAGARLSHVVLLRLLPVLPFTLVNLCCGAFDVPFFTFVLGSALGMLPGIVAIAFLGERAIAMLLEPTPQSVGAFALSVVVVVVAAGTVSVVLKRRIQRRKDG